MSPPPPPGTDAGSLLVRLRGLRPQLAPSEGRVAEAILADARLAARSTISELAASAETSETTVLRLCKRLGLAGYPQLRLGLAEASASSVWRDEPAGDLSPEDTIDDVVARVAFLDGAAVEETTRHLDRAVLERVARLLAGAHRIDLYGQGASALVAADLQQKLHRIGTVSFTTADPHQALASAALLGPDDVAVGVSHSGETSETVEALAAARRAGAHTVALTGVPLSTLARSADEVLVTSARETPLRAGATASRIAALTVVDCLFIAVARQDVAAAERAVEESRAAVRHRRKRLGDGN